MYRENYSFVSPVSAVTDEPLFSLCPSSDRKSCSILRCFLFWLWLLWVQNSGCPFSSNYHAHMLLLLLWRIKSTLFDSSSCLPLHPVKRWWKIFYFLLSFTLTFHTLYLSRLQKDRKYSPKTVLHKDQWQLVNPFVYIYGVCFVLEWFCLVGWVFFLIKIVRARLETRSPTRKRRKVRVRAGKLIIISHN